MDGDVATLVDQLTCFRESCLLVEMQELGVLIDRYIWI